MERQALTGIRAWSMERYPLASMEYMDMLVLTRRRSETICLVHDGKIICEVMLLDIRGNNVKIGIQCDKEIKILRKEVHDDQSHL